jgi:predicted dehydrogenase
MRVAFNDLDPAEKVRLYEKSVAVTDIEALNYGEFQLQIRDGDIISPRIQVREPLKHQIQHFADCVLTGQKPLSDGKSSLNVIECLEAIDQSIQANGQPIYLGTKETIYD